MLDFCAYMSMTPYQHILDYLRYSLPSYRKDGAMAVQPGPERIRELCYRLGLPQWQFHSVHVGGTNGKGSVSAMLASILMEAGYTTGLFASPELRSFTEQIRLNGRQIAKAEVVRFVNDHREMIEEVRPSFFELTVALAFKYFSRQEVEMAVIEVGMGGSMDATNIISPELSVITNVSLDHVGILGDTVEEIAREKAGIIKKFTPLVLGASQPGVNRIFTDRAEGINAPIRFAPSHVKVKRLSHNFHHQRVRASGKLPMDLQGEYKLGLIGDYQLANFRTCLCAVEQLREEGWDLPARAVQRGIKRVRQNTGLSGRMQLIQDSPPTLCDAAHNPAGLQAAMAYLQKLSVRRPHLVLGMLADKPLDDMLAELPTDAQYYFVQPQTPRALAVDTLHRQAETRGLHGTAYKDVREGIAQAQKNATSQDLVLVMGSHFVVAEALDSIS